MNSLDPEMLYQHFALLKNYIIQFLLSVALIGPSLLVQFEQLDWGMNSPFQTNSGSAIVICTIPPMHAIKDQIHLARPS
jgi:hypothetical protein